MGGDGLKQRGREINEGWGGGGEGREGGKVWGKNEDRQGMSKEAGLGGGGRKSEGKRERERASSKNK